MSDQACQTPLTDRLCFVPIDARLTIKHSETNHSFVPVGRLCNEAAAELDRLRAELAARDAECAPFLKDGETPAECIARWRSEAVAVLELLRQERVRSEKAEAELAARPTQWAYEQACNARNSRAERAEAECARLREALRILDGFVEPAPTAAQWTAVCAKARELKAELAKEPKP